MYDIKKIIIKKVYNDYVNTEALYCVFIIKKNIFSI